MKVATSGSRQEPTRAQAAFIRKRILALPAGTTIITGGCVGVDALIARVAFTAYRYRVLTILPADHKAVDPQWEEYCHFYIQMPTGTTYRDRDEEVVRRGEILLAYPLYHEFVHATSSGDWRSRRSGTWMTIRIARRTGKEVEVSVLDDVKP